MKGFFHCQLSIINCQLFPMLPLRDNIPTRSFPVSTILIIALNIAVFIYQLTLKEAAVQRLVYHMGAIPYEIVHPRDIFNRHGFPYPLTIFTSMFLHGGLLHVLGNMLYLWIFGNNVEDNLGHIKFIVFYLLCGIAAAGLHIYLNQDSRIPMIGASGAVSGVLGAYILLYPQAKIQTLVPVFFFMRECPGSPMWADFWQAWSC